MTAKTRFNELQGLRHGCLWLALLLVHVCVVSGFAQTNPVYAWRNVTGQPGGNGDADGPAGTARFFDPSSVAVDGVGNIYVADAGNNTIRKITHGGVVTTLAGSAGMTGSADGTNAVARFNHPSGVAVDSAGIVYVADTGNHTIRWITSNGAVMTLAGSAGHSGSADGTNDTAFFNSPRGVAVDKSGNIYVADAANNTIRQVTGSGVVTTLAGRAGFFGSDDGTNDTALFSYPAGVALDGAGNLYVADLDNNTIRKVTSGGVVTTLAGSADASGSDDGTNDTALFLYPTGVATDTNGNIYVADTGNSTIRRVTCTGVVTTLAGTAGQLGNTDDTGGAAAFDYPYGVAVDPSGNVCVADFGNATIRQVTSAGVVTTLAGSASQPGSTDVLGSAARFNNPAGVAADNAGNVYVADQGNHTIRKVAATGLITTLAGSAGLAGSADGTNATAQFNGPAGLALDGAGNLYVADAGNNTIRKVTSAGVVTTLAGSAGLTGSADGTNDTARFNHPLGLAVDSAGIVYVTDTGNNTIRKITSSGVVTTLAGSAGFSGSTDDTNTAARFNGPAGVAVDSADNLYVADAGNATIRRVTSSGVVATLAGRAGFSGTADGANTTARFTYPFGVTVDGAGIIYVTDMTSFTIRKITTHGLVSTFAGSAGFAGSTDATNTAAQFNQPSGVTVDSAGNLYVADSGNNTIRKITSGGLVTTLAGGVGESGSADVAASMARFFIPIGVAVDGTNNIYVADAGNSTLRRITPAGVATTLAGSAGQPGSADGTNATAAFDFPYGVAVDSAGTVYVADTGNSTIRKVTGGGVVTTLAGSAGQFGSADGWGDAAQFNYPSGVAVDQAGNVYVADTGNNTIRKITSGGQVTTLAGSAGQFGSADGTNGTAQFNYPSGVAVDSAGNVYVADTGNHTIRKITAGGMVTTLAGSAGFSGSADGTNSLALFNFPYGVAVDSAGTIFVGDSGNNTIRKITASGLVTTIGGLAVVMGGADGLGSAGSFAGPEGVAVDGRGRIYVADAGNNRISRGTPLPNLGLTRTGLTLRLSWPSPFTGFVLQQNPDLGNPDGWIPATYSLSNDGTNQSLSLALPPGDVFFRLIGD